jgi:hypothetical protein
MIKKRTAFQLGELRLHLDYASGKEPIPYEEVTVDMCLRQVVSRENDLNLFHSVEVYIAWGWMRDLDMGDFYKPRVVCYHVTNYTKRSRLGCPEKADWLDLLNKDRKRIDDALERATRRGHRVLHIIQP